MLKGYKRNIFPRTNKIKVLKKCANCSYMGIKGHATYCPACSDEVASRNRLRYVRRVRYAHRI